MAKVTPVGSGPTYPLDRIKQLLDAGACVVTGKAEQDARSELGLARSAVEQCVRALSPSDFYKTMPSEKVPGLYQDVYRPVFRTPFHQGGIEVYCKVQINKQGKAVIVAFKLL
jgi:motility quorum-sensing regulator/GCU-specific mRNA interferase toxin